jgi:hypothetical protein
VTGATKLPVNDLDHIDATFARLELETKIGMAHFTGKADAVEPVWKYYGPDIDRIRVVIDNDIAVFGKCEIAEDIGIGQNEGTYKYYAAARNKSD